MQVKRAAARTLSSQFLFTALIFVVLHHSREMVALEQSRTATGHVPDYGLYELLSPVLFDFGLLGTGFVLALLMMRFFGHPLAVQRVAAVTLLALTFFGALCVLYEAKTGDWLSLQVVAFGIANANEVAGIIVNEITLWQWGAVLLSVLVLATSLFYADRIGRRFLASLCGFGLMAIASNGISQDDGQQSTYFSRAVQLGWLNEQSPAWHGSIIVSALGYGHGEVSRLNALPPLQAYSSPEYVSQEGARPNVVLIVLESVRFSVTSPYSTDEHFGAITPNLSKIAAEGVVVDRAYTTVPHTSKALVGIFCGQFPRRELAIREAEPDGLPFNCLPRIMSRAGYQTAYFQSADGTYE
ncbi:MAG: sulfatase-like hydrolase/transferase, partial [Anaerolineales bacterium]